jgi:hypothetical protein
MKAGVKTASVQARLAKKRCRRRKMAATPVMLKSAMADADTVRERAGA